jgi:branched-chain amino acid transport system ATP-binding protein
VLGRNGAGKTTLLRAISGVIPCRSGRILVAGRDVRGLPAHRIARHGVGHVPEGRRVIPAMTVQDNLKLGGHFLRRHELEQQLEELYQLFPLLSEWGKRNGASLSGGQQQMLSIARALVARPDVVLLDEPLTGLAPILRAEVLRVIARMKTTRAILLVEQNAAETLPIADRAVVIHEGRIVLSGAAADLQHDDAVQESFLGIRTTGR